MGAEYVVSDEALADALEGKPMQFPAAGVPIEQHGYVARLVIEAEIAAGRLIPADRLRQVGKLIGNRFYTRDEGLPEGEQIPVFAMRTPAEQSRG